MHLGYYFAAFGRTSDRFPVAVARALLWSGIVVAVLALVDKAIAWNVWNIDEFGQGSYTRRVVSTFSSATEVASYLGFGLVFAVAILAWRPACR